MINHDKVKKYSEEMLNSLAEMEELVKKIKPKTQKYDDSVGDDISAKARDLMDEILRTLQSFKKVVEEKTGGVNRFATKVGNSERKQTNKLSGI